MRLFERSGMSILNRLYAVSSSVAGIVIPYIYKCAGTAFLGWLCLDMILKWFHSDGWIYGSGVRLHVRHD